MNTSVAGSSIAALSLLVLGIVILTTQNADEVRPVQTWSSGTLTDIGSILPAEQEKSFGIEQKTSVVLPGLQTSDPIEEEPASNQPQGAVASRQTFSEQVANFWSLVPTGLSSIQEPKTTRSALQNELYRYGNVAGEYLQALDDRYGARQVIVMQDFYADRQNEAKQQEVRRLAQALTETGENLAAQKNVPAAVRTQHTHLSEGYKSIGSALSKIPAAASDENLLAAITTYNTAAEAFITSYVSLVEYFSLAQVVFTEDDPGKMFMFSGSQPSL